MAEILDEIPRLTPVERWRLAEKLSELEGDWIDDELTPEEKRLLDSRLAGHDRHPGSAIPREEVKARLEARFVRWSFRVLLLPEAETDIGDAATWHEGQKAGLGGEFAEAVFHAGNGLSGNPLLTSRQHP